VGSAEGGLVTYAKQDAPAGLPPARDGTEAAPDLKLAKAGPDGRVAETKHGEPNDSVRPILDRPAARGCAPGQDMDLRESQHQSAAGQSGCIGIRQARTIVPSAICRMARMKMARPIWR
jgi:hypothetical protein